MSIPVFISRFSSQLPEKYGAFIPFNIGERVIAAKKDGDEISVYVRSKLKLHASAPVIDSAAGEGRYIYEVSETPDGELFAVSAEILRLY